MPSLRESIAVALLNEDAKSKLKKAGKVAGAAGALGAAGYAATHPEKVEQAKESIKKTGKQAAKKASEGIESAEKGIKDITGTRKHEASKDAIERARAKGDKEKVKEVKEFLKRKKEHPHGRATYKYP